MLFFNTMQILAPHPFFRICLAATSARKEKLSKLLIISEWKFQTNISHRRLRASLSLYQTGHLS